MALLSYMGAEVLVVAVLYIWVWGRIAGWIPAIGIIDMGGQQPANFTHYTSNIWQANTMGVAGSMSCGQGIREIERPDVLKISGRTAVSYKGKAGYAGRDRNSDRVSERGK